MNAVRVAWESLSESLSSAGLTALREALVKDDPRLVQGLTVVGDSAVRCACAVAYCGWKDGTFATVTGANFYFSSVIVDSDRRSGSKSTAPFLDWFDRVPRKIMLKELLLMVERTLEVRRAKA